MSNSAENKTARTIIGTLVKELKNAQITAQTRNDAVMEIDQRLSQLVEAIAMLRRQKLECGRNAGVRLMPETVMAALSMIDRDLYCQIRKKAGGYEENTPVVSGINGFLHEATSFREVSAKSVKLVSAIVREWCDEVVDTLDHILKTKFKKPGEVHRISHDTFIRFKRSQHALAMEQLSEDPACEYEPPLKKKKKVKVEKEEE
jgi:hypothetical protein